MGCITKGAIEKPRLHSEKYIEIIVLRSSETISTDDDVFSAINSIVNAAPHIIIKCIKLILGLHSLWVAVLP
ncbi:MAG: hypothetical protein ACP6IU_00845 [Candidatus Asgardarchaeia archaeon]